MYMVVAFWACICTLPVGIVLGYILKDYSYRARVCRNCKHCVPSGTCLYCIYKSDVYDEDYNMTLSSHTCSHFDYSDEIYKFMELKKKKQLTKIPPIVKIKKLGD